MIYGEEKVYQMVRSILPSAGAKRAREEKKFLNKKLRRNARQKLSKITSKEDWDDNSFDFWNDGEMERTYIVGDRRGNDKLRHFEKWAEHKAKDIPAGLKMGYIKGLVKRRGVIIDHAYSHLEHLDGFGRDTARGNRDYSSVDTRIILTREKIDLAIQNILEDSWAHASLNRTIKRNMHTVTWYVLKEYISNYRENGDPEKAFGFFGIEKAGEPVLLLGAHNVDEFISFYRNESELRLIRGDGIHYSIVRYGNYTKDWIKNPRYQPHLNAGVRKFIETYIDYDGDPVFLLDVEQNFHSGFFDKVYYRRVSQTTKYNWKW